MQAAMVWAWMSVAGAAVAAPAQILQVRAEPGAQAPAVPAIRVQALLRAAVSQALPVGWRLQQVALQGAPVDTAGAPLQIEPQFLAPLVAGPQTITVQMRRGNAPPWRQQASISLQRVQAAAAVPVLQRGSEVTVVIRSTNVLVQSKAIAQSVAGIGEWVTVLPTGGQRTLQARVLDDRTVEVSL